MTKEKRFYITCKVFGNDNTYYLHNDPLNKWSWIIANTPQYFTKQQADRLVKNIENRGGYLDACPVVLVDIHEVKE